MAYINIIDKDDKVVASYESAHIPQVGEEVVIAFGEHPLKGRLYVVKSVGHMLRVLSSGVKLEEVWVSTERVGAA